MPVGIFEGLTSMNDLTSIQVVVTLLGGAQRSSMPLIEEFDSKAASLCSFVGLCSKVQRGKTCQQQSYRHYYSYQFAVVIETAVAIAAVCSMNSNATCSHRSLLPLPQGTQCRLPGPIGL